MVENRPGGATTIGTRAVIEAAPDGHTFFFTSSTSLVVTPHTTKLTFNPLTPLAPVILAANISPAMAVAITRRPIRRAIDRLRKKKSRQT